MTLLDLKEVLDASYYCKDVTSDAEVYLNLDTINDTLLSIVEVERIDHNYIYCDLLPLCIDIIKNNDNDIRNYITCNYEDWDTNWITDIVCNGLSDDNFSELYYFMCYCLSEILNEWKEYR